MKKLLIFTVLISSLTLAGLWSGRKVCTVMSPADTGSIERAFSGLGLSASETESLKKTESAFREELDTLCMQICQERANLLKQLKEGISVENATRKVDAIGRLQILMEKKIINHLMELKKILTPAQSAAYLDKIYQQQCRMISPGGYDKEKKISLKSKS